MSGSTGNGNGRQISEPLVRRFKRFGQRTAPAIVWVSAIGVALILMRSQIHQIATVGIVECRDMVVAPLESGKLAAVAVELFDHVQKGAVVAVLDDTMLKSQINTAHAELQRLRAEIEATRDKYTLDIRVINETEARRATDDRRRFDINAETARIDLIDRMVQQEADQVTLARLKISLDRQEKLMTENIIARDLYDNLRLEYEALRTKTQENEKAIAFAKQRLNESTRRLHERIDAHALATSDTLWAPLVEAVKVQEARIAELSERARGLVLRAPIAGSVSSIVRQAGEVASAGQPIITLNAPNSMRVVAYIDERAAHGIKVGSPVEMASRRYPREVIQAKVSKVGAKIESYPLRLMSAPNFLRYGLAISIEGIPNGRFIPGEVLDLRVRTETSG
ncbi:MAG: HlyD family efflux transporter periplasmic adaptor subunit [Candidatus Sumerlaeota bacterium]|nr:HlyD family efflux transporter periplasmic adaptor subunit [Candidatus Sumerlaeota bacterium]